MNRTAKSIPALAWRMLLPLVSATAGTWAQSPAVPAAPSASSAPPSVQHHASPAKHATRKHAAAPSSESASAPVAQLPAQPPAPDWPVNDKAQPASVSWNGRNLTIAAANSSLDQILQEVSIATGVKIEGYDSAARDQRIFGSYGPAPAPEVLYQLLDASGYNIIMVGDLGSGAPRELLLASQVKSAQSGAAHSNPVQPNGEEEPAEEPEPPEQQPATPPPGMRTPQQMRQELMQRQQQQQFPQQPPSQAPAPPNE